MASRVSHKNIIGQNSAFATKLVIDNKSTLIYLDFRFSLLKGISKFYEKFSVLWKQYLFKPNNFWPRIFSEIQIVLFH